MVLHINPIIEYHISPKDLVQSDLRRHQCMHQYTFMVRSGLVLTSPRISLSPCHIFEVGLRAMRFTERLGGECYVFWRFLQSHGP